MSSFPAIGALLMGISLASPAVAMGVPGLQMPPQFDESMPALRAAETPEKLKNVGVDEKLGVAVDRNLTFTTYAGEVVTLGDVLADDRPTILTFNYSNCPMLCSVQLNSLVRTLNGMSWNLGDEYDILTVTVDPNETPQQASEARARYLKGYEKDATEDAWTFLVSPGDEPTIKALANQVGFRYSLNPDNGEWLHTAAMILLGGEKDEVSRYMYGVELSPKTVQLSLAEASDGKRVSTVDRVFLYCFQYDPNSGSYTPVIINIMKLGGALTAFAVLAFLTATFLRARAEERELAESRDRLPGSDNLQPTPDPHRSPST